MHRTQDIDIAFVGLNSLTKALVLRASFTGGHNQQEQKRETETEYR
jgi:hypothetical protein